MNGDGHRLSELDMRILARLKEDPTASNLLLARDVGLTRSQLLSRLNRIESLDIAHVVALTDIGAGGARLYYVYVAVGNRPVDEVAEEMARSPYATTVAGLLGTDDLLVALRLPAGHEPAKVVDIVKDVPGVSSLRALQVLRFYTMKNEHMRFSTGERESLDARIARLAEELAGTNIDELDYALIAEFQSNGRVPVRDLSQRYGLTQGAIRYRLKNLDSKKVLRLGLVIDPVALGLRSWAGFEIDVVPAKIDAVVANLGEQSWNVLLMLSGGTSMLQCVALTADIEGMREALRHVRSLDGVNRVIPQIFSRIYYNEPHWGLFED